MNSARSRTFMDFHISATPGPYDAASDCRVQPCSLRELLLQRRRQPLHLLLEGFIIIFHVRRAHVPARREDVTTPSDLIGGCGLAEAGQVLVLARALVAAPCMVSASDALDLRVGKLTMNAV